MFIVENDWVQYETVPARRIAVKGGAACGQRNPVVRARIDRPGSTVQVPVPQRRPVPAVASRPTVPVRRRLRLTRRGRFVLIVLPGVLVLTGAVAAIGVPLSFQAAPPPATHVVSVVLANG